MAKIRFEIYRVVQNISQPRAKCEQNISYNADKFFISIILTTVIIIIIIIVFVAAEITFMMGIIANVIFLLLTFNTTIITAPTMICFGYCYCHCYHHRFCSCFYLCYYLFERKDQYKLAGKCELWTLLGVTVWGEFCKNVVYQLHALNFCGKKLPTPIHP